MDKDLDKRVNEEGRIERIKRNIRENRKTYIGSGIGFIVGAIGSAVFLTLKYGVKESEIVESCVTRIINKVGGRNNRLTIQTISMYGNVIGRPGIPVIDTTTGKRFESMSLAADAIGVTVNRMSAHLRGKTDHLNGHRFELAP